MSNTTKHTFFLSALLVATSSLYTAQEATHLANLNAACSTREFKTIEAYKAGVAAALSSGNYTRKDIIGVHNNILNCRDCLENRTRIGLDGYIGILCTATRYRKAIPEEQATKKWCNKSFFMLHELKCYNVSLELLKEALHPSLGPVHGPID